MTGAGAAECGSVEWVRRFSSTATQHSQPTEPAIDVRRAADRFHTEIGWLDSYHSFSFSNHYDPNNVGHGQLIVNNDDVVRAGTGFGTHPHRDMEIVTWVLSGELSTATQKATTGSSIRGSRSACRPAAASATPR